MASWHEQANLPVGSPGFEFISKNLEKSRNHHSPLTTTEEDFALGVMVLFNAAVLGFAMLFAAAVCYGDAEEVVEYVDESKAKR